MPFIPVNLDDVQELKPVDAGNYELMATGCVATVAGEKATHPGAPGSKLTLGFVDPEIRAPVISVWLNWPYEGDDKAFGKLLQAKRIIRAFGMNEDDYREGIDTEKFQFEIIGKTAILQVGLSTPNENGDVFNTVRFPKLPEEAVRRAPSSRKRG